VKVRQTLDQAIGPTPVSTIDVNDLVARARRHSMRRRFAIVGAAGGAAFAAAGLAAALIVNSAGSPPLRHQAAPGASQSSGPVNDGTAPVRAGESHEQSQRRVTRALSNGLTTALPGVQLSDGVTGKSGVIVSSTQGGPVGYAADTLLTTATVQGEVFFESWVGGIAPGATPTDSPSDQPPSPKVITWLESCANMPTATAYTGEGYALADDCVDSVGPEGQTIVAVTERCPDCPGQPTFRHDVYVTWNNARVGLSVVSSTKRGGPNGALAPLLNRDQVIAVATDPDLTVTS